MWNETANFSTDILMNISKKYFLFLESFDGKCLENVFYEIDVLFVFLGVFLPEHF